MHYNMPRFDIQNIVGTSDETKPANVRPGSVFTEADTGKTYLLTDDEGWVIASKAGEGWRLWDGEEPLADATTHKWVVDCEMEVTAENVVDGAIVEGQAFYRKGDDFLPPVIGVSTSTTVGGRPAITGVGAVRMTSNAYSLDGIEFAGYYVPVSAQGEAGTAAEIDAALAVNDEEQPDRIMIWIKDA